MRKKQQIYRNNPNHVEARRLILDNWDEIQALTPDPDWLPDMDKAEFGCGVFGCVWPTSDPDVVFKLTTDTPDIINTLQMFVGTKIACLPKFYKVATLMSAEDLRGHPVSVIWREDITPMQDRYGTPPYNFTETIYNFNDGARNVRSFLASGSKRYDIAIKKLAKHITEDLYHNFPNIAIGIVQLLQLDLLITDLHGGNIGQNSDDEWVIFDPLFIFLPSEVAETILAEVDKLEEEKKEEIPAEHRLYTEIQLTNFYGALYYNGKRIRTKIIEDEVHLILTFNSNATAELWADRTGYQFGAIPENTNCYIPVAIPTSEYADGTIDRYGTIDRLYILIPNIKKLHEKLYLPPIEELAHDTEISR